MNTGRLRWRGIIALLRRMRRSGWTDAHVQMYYAAVRYENAAHRRTWARRLGAL